jgi:hypothetical protein
MPQKFKGQRKKSKLASPSLNILACGWGIRLGANVAKGRGYTRANLGRNFSFVMNNVLCPGGPSILPISFALQANNNKICVFYWVR